MKFTLNMTSTKSIIKKHMVTGGYVKMKKTWKTVVLTGVMSLALAIPAFAGSWQTDAAGYWYQNDDSTYPASCWKWIDGNNDGVAECYYFDERGCLLVSTITPDGCTVDANGAWVVNGIVQTQVAAQAPLTAPTQTPVSLQTGTSDSTSTVSMTDMVWLPANGERFHKINNCGNMNPEKARSVSAKEAYQNGYEPCTKCY